ncbi:GTP-binding protein [Nocardia puris]|uniref:G3E family GTPase n=1 Tax=Nocardia puris TaxID=208602 RepID=A0A366DKL7_9NOCA|nr:GTP-binding protein [Nocardia puris]RBO90623.1 G3E family GTPase [Nocardia puris]
MRQVDVLAVIGTCAPERGHYASRLAETTRRTFVPAHRLTTTSDPVEHAATLTSWPCESDGILIEFPTTTPATEVIGTFSGDATTLTGVVCVADAAHLLGDLRRDNNIHAAGTSPEHDTPYAKLTVTQLEYASTIVLVNWTALPTATLSTVMGLVSHLSPRARVHLHQDPPEPWRPGEPYTIAQDRPGWIGLLNDDHAPRLTDPGVSAFRYENARPLHPGRLQHLLDRLESGTFGTVVRSAGFCRLATRPHTVALWDHVGHIISFDPLTRDDELTADDDLLALGQDLAFIGLGLDPTALTTALDETALTDAEFAAGPQHWTHYPDPFPAWITVDNGAD